MKAKHLVIVLLLLLYLFLSSSILTLGHYWGGDFSAYIMQSVSFLEGTESEFIHQNSFTIQNSNAALGPINYPWGFPILISPVIYLFGINLLALKSINILIYLLFLVCIFLLFAGRLSFVNRLVMLAFFAFSPVIIQAHDNILSDIPFLFFSTISVFMIDRFILSEKKLVSFTFDNLLLGFSIFAAYSTRTNGALLLLVLLITQIVKRITSLNTNPINTKRIYLNVLPYLAFFTLLGLSMLKLPDSSASYISQSDGLNIVRAVKFLYRYTMLLPTMLHTYDYESPFNIFLFIIFLPFALMGVLSRWRSDYHFIIYSGFTLILYSYPPFIAGLRYVFPVLPFYIYFILVGWDWLSSILKDRNLRVVRYFGNALLLIILLVGIASSLSLAIENLSGRRQIEGPYDRSSTEMFRFITKNTGVESTIVFFKPRVLRLITGRRSLKALYCPNILLGDYLVFHKEKDKERISIGEIQNCSPQPEFDPIFDNQVFTVYRIRKH